MSDTLPLWQPPPSSVPLDVLNRTHTSTRRRMLLRLINVHAGAFFVYKGRDGKYYWELRDADASLVATAGDGYNSRIACDCAIETLKRLHGVTVYEL